MGRLLETLIYPQRRNASGIEMKTRFTKGRYFLYWVCRAEILCRYVGTVSIFRHHWRRLVSLRADDSTLADKRSLRVFILRMPMQSFRSRKYDNYLTIEPSGRGVARGSTIGGRTDENCFATQLSTPTAFQHHPGVEPMVSKCCNSDCMTALQERNQQSLRFSFRRFSSGVNVIFPRGKN
jgi:hypothetical protein